MRLARINFVMPKTREFLLALYDGEANYLSYTYPPENPYSFLDTICMMYDNSIDFPASPQTALDMLGLSSDGCCEVNCACNSSKGRNKCSLSVSSRCGMSSLARLHDELTRILSSRQEIEKYSKRS